MRAATRDAMTVATRRWMWVATAAMIWVVEGVGLLIAVGAAIGAAIWAREGGAMSAAAMVVIWAAAVPAILAAWRCVAWAGLRASTRVVARMLGATEAAMWDAAMDETKPATWDATEAVTVASNVLFIDGVPIPEDAHVLPAPQSASETQKRLLGAWVGTWNHSCRHILIVEDIHVDGEARVVWANGDDSEWSREEGIVSGDTLTTADGLITYKLTATDKLLAECECFTHIANARMSRIELAALTRPGATINWPDGVEFLDTDLTEDGKRVRLEVVLFKPNGSGPFPLLVFNHGRIYKGTLTSPTLTETETHPNLAEFFLEKGWMVAFPQRRGRGKSDGLHGEGSGSTWDQRGYTDDPGRNLAGADRALNDIETAIAALQRRPDVAGKRLLIGGAS